MYLDPEEEKERDSLNLTYNIMLYVGVSLIVGLAFHFGWWLAFDIEPWRWFSIILVIITGVTFFNATWKEGVAYTHVPTNWVYMTFPPDAEKEDDGKSTEVIEYTAGYHYRFILEEDGPKIFLGRDIRVKFEIKVSTTDDDIDLKGEAYFRPDHKNLRTFILNGDSFDEQLKNVREAFEGIVADYTERVASEYTSDEIVTGLRKGDDGEVVERGLRKQFIDKVIALFEGEDAYEMKFGIQTSAIVFSAIDYAEEVSKARRMKKMAHSTTDAVAVFLNHTDEKTRKQYEAMGADKLLAHLRVMADESEGKDIHVHGLIGEDGSVSNTRTELPLN